MTNIATVYTTNTCPYCTMMTNYLKEQNIEFKEVNVQDDPAAGQKLVETTGQMGVPQTELNGEWILGFNPDAIQEALKLK
ncbi:glutaredoxin family protein [Sporosarcina sp. CAU 1771]